MTKPTGRPRGRPKGSTTKKLPALVIGEADKARREARKEQLDEGLDSLAMMRRCLKMIANEIPPALAKVREIAAEANDQSTLLKAVVVLKETIIDCHTVAKDIAPYEHRRLAGERPLKDETGPRTLVLTAQERAL